MLEEKFFCPSPKKVADKSATPEETISLVTERLSAAGASIFQELRRVDKGRLGIPVYLSLYGAEGLALTGNLKQMGKGSSEALAKASALMELVERFSLFRFVKKGAFPLRTYEELGDKALPLEELVSSVKDPEEDREAERVFWEFIPRVPLHFAPALDVSRKRERLLPLYWFWLLYEYNGSAAGNTYAEAAVQATCELIERHTSALASQKKGPFKEVVPDRLGEEARKLLSCYERLGVRLYLRDLTFGFPVATIGALAYDPKTFPARSEIVYTAGTATSPERALIRALTEVAQLAGDFDTEGKYLESGLPKFASLEEAAPVLSSAGKIRLSELPDLSQEDHAEELRHLAQELSARGFRLYLLDIAAPELGLPAVYALIPGILFRERIFLSPLYQLVRTVALHLPPELALEVLSALDREISRYYVASYLGQTLARLGRWEEAEASFRRALSLSPATEDLPALYCHLAHAAFQGGRLKEAEEAAEKGLSFGPLPELYNLLGSIRFRRGLVPQALEAYFQAVALNPQAAVDYANIGACLLALGLTEEAEEYFKNAKMLDPGLDVERFRRVKPGEGGANV